MSTDHIIKSYDDEMTRLAGELMRMGGMAVDQLQTAITLVRNPRTARAVQVVEADTPIDMLERTIDTDAVRLLALRAPMASDLRQVFAALRIASDLERIGDYAVGIARRTMALVVAAPENPLQRLEHMADLALAAVREALDAYHEQDTTRARRVWIGDTSLDEAWTDLFRELLACMRDDASNIPTCAQMLFMAKHVERIGDHATNIAEHVWYAVKGEIMPSP
ncbi:MAG TPA: phosphate signaling complex protein PhoU [Rhodanobacteraceae bacterium]